MKILLVHKFYYVEGGAERYFFNVKQLLEEHGHEVIPFAMQHPRNEPTPYAAYFPSLVEADGAGGGSPLQRLSNAARFVYNREAQRKLQQLIEDTRPGLAHVHGVYHHLSPAVLPVLKRAGIPVVFTLHEYKILCPGYLFLDGKGRVCEKCQGRAFWHAAVNRCFRGSYAGGALVAVESYVHRWLRSYRDNVDRFHSPSRFLRSKMIQYGWDGDRIDWLPYTLAVQEFVPHYEPGDYVVFVGRLQREKGIQVLIEAMPLVERARLVVVGTGPLEQPLKARAKQLGLTSVEFVGYKSGQELRNLVAGARFTVVPSVVYDNSPLTIYESFSLGKPVVGARIGGIPELIEPGVDGELCEPGDPRSLAQAITSLWDRGEGIREMGKRAREKAERLFEPEQHYEKLMAIYEKASHAS